MRVQSLLFSHMLALALLVQQHAQADTPEAYIERLTDISQVSGEQQQECPLHDFVYSEGKDKEKRRTPKYRNKIYKKMAKAQREVEVGNFEKGSAMLDELLDKNQLNSYEEATIYYLQAFIKKSQEDYIGASQAYEAVVAQPDIPFAMEQISIYEMADLSFAMKDYCKSLEYLNRFMSGEAAPKTKVYSKIALNYFSNGQKDQAAVYFKKTIELEQSSDPADTDLLIASHLRLASIYKDRSHEDAKLNAQAALALVESSELPKDRELFSGFFYWYLALAYGELGQLDLAIESAEKAIDLQNDDDVPETWHAYLAKLRKSKGTL